MGKRLCAWHALYFPDEPAPVLAEFEGDGESGGICARCLERELSERPPRKKGKNKDKAKTNEGD
jgi:hypothetical protein